MTHIRVSSLTTIGSGNGLSPDRHQAIIWTNSGILLTGPLGTNFSETLIEIYTVLFEKIHLKMSSRKWLPHCQGVKWWYILIWGRWWSYCTFAVRHRYFKGPLSRGTLLCTWWYCNITILHITIMNAIIQTFSSMLNVPLNKDTNYFTLKYWPCYKGTTLHFLYLPRQSLIFMSIMIRPQT